MGETIEETSSEREIPSGWRQQCSQGHRSGLARKCKLNNHGSTYISPDGAKFEDLESVYQSLYGAKGDIWKVSPVSLEEIDETQIQAGKRRRTGYNAQKTVATVRKPPVKPRVSTVRKYPAVNAVFKCGQCSYSFMSKDNLKTHLQNKHGNAQSNPPTKTPQKLVSKWVDIMNTALDKTVVNQPKVARIGLNQEEIIIDEIVPVTKSGNRSFVNIASHLDKRSTIKPLPKQSPSISIQPAKIIPTGSQTILKTNSGLSIKLNQYPKADLKVSQSPETSRLSSLSSISVVKSSQTSMISPTVSVSKEKFSLRTVLNPKITEGFSFKDSKSNPNTEKKTVDVPGIVSIRRTAFPKEIPEQQKPVLEKPKPVPEKSRSVPEKHKPVPTHANHSIHFEPESPAIILSSKDQELAQQEMLFLATPLKCYFCELGRSRMSKSDPAEFFHLQLEMNGQLGKGNPSNRDVENLASYLRVNIGIARKVLQHIGVANQTKESKNRLSFIRRICWDNIESLRDLCNSFEQVWRSVNMLKDPFHISQEVLGQVYRWKFLFTQDPYYQTFLSQVFIHIHQGQDNVYNFMRNKVVDIEIE